MSFVPIPLEDLDTFLTKRGFTPDVVGNERVYTRVGRNNPTLKLVVYTSVAVGETKGRKVGKDAIRVLLLGLTPGHGRDGTRCLAKTTRINRTGTVEGILDRIKDRLLEAATASTNYGPACPHCGAPTYADSRRCVVPQCRSRH